jgi:hypothetical protein
MKAVPAKRSLTARGASSPAKPALHIPEPLSITSCKGHQSLVQITGLVYLFQPKYLQQQLLPPWLIAEISKVRSCQWADLQICTFYNTSVYRTHPNHGYDDVVAIDLKKYRQFRW